MNFDKLKKKNYNKNLKKVLILKIVLLNIFFFINIRL